MNSLINQLLPPISKDFALALDTAFRPLSITPDTSLEEIMFNAGERKVVEWILSKSRVRVVSGDPEVLAERPGASVEEQAGRTEPKKKTMWEHFTNRSVEHE